MSAAAVTTAVLSLLMMVADENEVNSHQPQSLPYFSFSSFFDYICKLKQ